MLVSVLPKGQFHVSNTKTVLDSIKQWVQMAADRYGSSFRWIKMIGDISAMYDECDPELAIVAAHTAVDSASEWAGKRGVKCCNVSYGGRDGKWGKPNTDHRIVIVFELLLQLIEFDCRHTYYKFRGKVNRRKFGLPMGGFMSPFLAILMCSMAELAMGPGPEDMIGGCFRYMDDVF